MSFQETIESWENGVEPYNATTKQLTCERCGQKTDAGAWIGFVYVGAECLTSEDKEYIE